MNEVPPGKRPPDEPAEGDIEILEVIGLDEDSPPTAGGAPDDEEIEVVFDEPSGVVSEPADWGPAGAESVDAEAVFRERLIRLQADFENYKKRTERERSEYARHATESLVARLLPILDNFERAMLMSSRGSTEEENFRLGITLIHRQLLDELRTEGLTPIVSEGRPFDPRVHEAVATEVTPEVPPNTVVLELQRGYFLHDRVLRPALVRVSVAPEDTGSFGDGQEEDGDG